MRRRHNLRRAKQTGNVQTVLAVLISKSVLFTFDLDSALEKKYLNLFHFCDPITNGVEATLRGRTSFKPTQGLGESGL